MDAQAGTILDRNNIGRLVYKEGAQSVEARKAMKAEAKARKEDKRLMEAYEASPNSVSFSFFNQNISRTSTPLPVEDEGYSPRLAAESSKFYPTEPFSPLKLPDSSAPSGRKKNFNFFKWTGNRKNSSASGSSHTPSDASMSPVFPSAGETINIISATPRVDIDLGPPHLSLTSAFHHSLDMNDRVRSMSVSSGMMRGRSESMTTQNTQFSTAPSSMQHTTASGSSASSAILAQRASDDTLGSASTLSGMRYSADPAEICSRFSFSSGEHDDNCKPAKRSRTMADLFLLGAAGSASKRNRGIAAFVPSPQNSSVVRFQQGRVVGTVDPQRPQTAGSSSLKSLRRRHSIGSDYSVPLPTSSRASTDVRKGKTPTAPSQRSRGGNEDAFASMFCAPKKKTPKKTADSVASKTTAETSVGTPVPTAVSSGTTPQAPVVELLAIGPKPPPGRSTSETLPVVKGKAVHSPRTLSLPAANIGASIGQAYEYPAPTTLPPPPPLLPSPPPPPNPRLNPLHDPLPAPPSSLLLDAFISLLEEYSSAPKLFSFSRPKAPSITSHRNVRQGILIRKGSFVSTTHSVSETIAEEISPTTPTSPTTSTGKYLTVSKGTTPNSTTDDEEFESSGYDDITFYDSFEEADFIHEKQKLESVVWFLSASKWLSFGRLLFSPGHHLLCMAQMDAELLGIDDMKILDLDGPALGGWSWHLAYEYPAALVYNITTSKRYFENYGLQHMQPLNHRLVLTESLTSLQPLESSSFDVITARALPRILQKHEWIPLLKECHRVLKPDGYIEVTIVDTLLNNMGPVTRAWIEENIINPALSRDAGCEGGGIDPHPSKSILHNLEAAGLVDIHKCWVWMPAGTIGDELSFVTSRVGRYFYDELFANWGANRTEAPSDSGIKTHRELGLWSDPRVQAECARDNTAFRWLKCHARKGNFPHNLAAAYH